ncbi:hypothetical protein POTOM_036771 [Populus tomentosa]|uniref:RRM domain-containing protein n=1 Tax=Populus tomentosa TaxID=118781 RepID=A0A8X8CNF8_POPTO|nr:hypothetical protein POTOM_036771 [Populus tomentosa]
MVLSNKKLKQKLRTVKAESLVSKVSNKPERDSKNGSLGNPESNSQLQELLAREAAKQRERLSKREKRRKTQSLQGIDSENKSQVGDNGEEDKKVEDEEKAGGEAEGVVEAAKVAGESEDIADRVYVGGIPYYSTEDDIRSFFEGCGTVTEVDCMTFPDSGKFRGIAIISFKVSTII